MTTPDTAIKPSLLEPAQDATQRKLADWIHGDYLDDLSQGERQDLIEQAEELTRKGKVYDNLLKQETLCGTLHSAWTARNECAKEAKKEYESAQRTLRGMIRAQNEDLPLFDQLEETEEWRDVLLSSLGMSETLVELLSEGRFDTIGQLADFTAAGNKVTDIEGIGPAKATLIDDFLLEFWAAHPGIGDSSSADPDGEVDGE